MRLEEAVIRITPHIGKKFGEIMNENDMQDIIKNKGKSGQLLEILLGLKNSNTTLDFEDGELKTNKCDKTGKPLETMFITQISGLIDELLEEKDFYESKLYKKIKNLLYVPISKDGQPTDWFVISATHVNLELPKFRDLREQLEKDYYSICRQLKKHIETSSDGFIHTSNGEFIQIRSKDSKPYFPIYSVTYKKHVSNKNHAFYFKKEFMKYIREISLKQHSCNEII
ncbi:MutH/Sau3AI family endonuclease [Clostridium thermarum]|uniref:MutH/Sau3AI family endonuclease n=1 Tax=Clostridium thermarum TaxID=1716543 RepID=UPI001123C962|nr:MutH/Sau3AI family endonuclease [Clostridium thermarum]